MTKELPFCECGCGERVSKLGNRFINGHNRRGVQLPPRTPEHCAAIKKAHEGVSLSPEHSAAIKKGREESDAVKVANEAQRGIPLSQETCAAMSVAHTGVPRSQEACDAISTGCRNSNAIKANADRMRGGNDLVTHHYIYDHDDLSKNTTQMTRSDHMSLHNVLRKLGYIVPHINTEQPKSL